MASTIVPDLAPVEELRRELELIGDQVLTKYHLADAIREGSSVTEQLVGGFIRQDTACAMGAGWIAARARNVVPAVKQ